MLKKSFRKVFQIPVEQKINILGLRIETGDIIECMTENNKLHLKDEWKIQIAYKPYDSGYQVPPQFMEKRVLWQDEFEWINTCTKITFAKYSKPPKCTLTHLEEHMKFTYILNLTLEGVIEIQIDEIPLAPVIINNPPPKPTEKEKDENAEALWPSWKQADLDLKQVNKRIAVLEKQYSELIEHLQKQAEQIDSLVDSLEKKSVAHSRISGYVLDSFRLIPVSKTIVEFYLDSQHDPIAKIASDARGYYTCDLLIPGTYEIRAKHPRFSPLIIKDYILKEGDNKCQDFLLRK